MQRLIDNLRSLAEAATPGPWEHDVDRFSDEEGIVAVITNVRQGPSIKDDMLVKIETGLLAHTDEAWKRARESQERRDAAYIAAASPDRIIALLDALAKSEAERARLDGICTTLSHLAVADHETRMGKWDKVIAAEAERDALAQQLEAMRIEHDIQVVTQHRESRERGGQHVGTGGPLAAANPSTLIYLERVVRDLRSALTTKQHELDTYKTMYYERHHEECSVRTENRLLKEQILAVHARAERAEAELEKRHPDECAHLLFAAPGSCARCEGT